MTWTAKDIPDQTGRVALVTGANGGLGYETALGLARAGARVLLAARDPQRGADALARMQAAAPAATIELVSLDLADLASIQRAARDVASRVPALDILVNNAGVMALPYRTTRDGFEMQLGTNHLGHFALTGRLLPLLLAARAPRVVTVSSIMHRIGTIRWDDLHWSKRYLRWPAYGQSKLANLLFAFELDRRAGAAGVPLTSVAGHPGYAATELGRVGPRMEGRRLGLSVLPLLEKLMSQSAEMGALPMLYGATAPDVIGGEYFGPDGFQETRGHPQRVGTTRRARDGEDAGRLWAISEELTGVTYAFTPSSEKAPAHTS